MTPIERLRLDVGILPLLLPLPLPLASGLSGSTDSSHCAAVAKGSELERGMEHELGSRTCVI